MATLIDMDGNSYNVELEIKNNILYAIWDSVPQEIDLDTCDIEIKERE